MSVDFTPWIGGGLLPGLTWTWIGEALDRIQDGLRRRQAAQVDGRLRRAVYRALGREPRLRSQRRALRVEVEQRVVTLRGHVASPQHAALAEACTRAVPGVMAVRSWLVSDAALERGIRQLLIRNRIMHAERIRPTSRLGQVTLTGEVESEELAQEAVEVAQAVPGVLRVRNELTVNPSLGSADAHSRLSMPQVAPSPQGVAA